MPIGLQQPRRTTRRRLASPLVYRRSGTWSQRGRRLSRRGALRRQAGPRRGGQDALHGGGLDQSRGAPAQGEAGAGQGLPQARDRARRQALAGPRRGGCDGRPGLLERTRRGRLQPPGDPHRVGPTGSPHGIVQMGEHDARQHQERDHRDLSQAWPRPCPRPGRPSSGPTGRRSGTPGAIPSATSPAPPSTARWATGRSARSAMPSGGSATAPCG